MFLILILQATIEPVCVATCGGESVSYPGTQSPVDVADAVTPGKQRGHLVRSSDDLSVTESRAEIGRC